jgi:hypothetical protein
MLAEYRKLHRKTYPNKPLLKLDDDLIRQVGALISVSPAKTRRNLQAAAAFSSFKLKYESRMPTADDELTDRDHYFFEIIMQKPFLRQQFGVGENALQLDDDKEEVLFQWAFTKSRKDGDDNQNILHKAEALSAWDRIRKYDEEHGTAFHKRLDVDAPNDAVSMRKIEADYLNHQTQSRPIDTLISLLAAVKTLNSEELVASGTQLTPILQELQKVISQRLKMIAAVAD